MYEQAMKVYDTIQNSLFSNLCKMEREIATKSVAAYFLSILMFLSPTSPKTGHY